jgi:RimJ/RimL family protein N-acetyltransferase
MKRLFSEIPYIKTERLVLRKLEETDADSLSELVHSQNVYRYLPTFLFEHKYENIHDVIRHLYNECFRDKRRLGLCAANFR